MVTVKPLHGQFFDLLVTALTFVAIICMTLRMFPFTSTVTCWLDVICVSALCDQMQAVPLADVRVEAMIL